MLGKVKRGEELCVKIAAAPGLHSSVETRTVSLRILRMLNQEGRNISLDKGQFGDMGALPCDT